MPTRHFFCLRKRIAGYGAPLILVLGVTVVYRALAEAIDLFETGLGDCHRSEERKQVEKYLAELGGILAAAVLGKDVFSRLARTERLFGNTWLVDETPFEEALAKWREFKTEYEAFAVRGMTVNERLHAFSMLESYDQAVLARDYLAVRRILEAVHVEEASIDKTITKIRGDA